MRTSSALAPLAAAVLALTAVPALALDGNHPAGPQVSAIEAFRSGAKALELGEKEKAITSLEYAAENGHPLAQWKLGRMYAKGDGVPRNDMRAFEYFSSIADAHAEDRPYTPQARIVADAFVALGHYYLAGIPQSPVRSNPARARQMFYYAATYFADPEAQYDLARLYLDGKGAPHDPLQAARWLALASHKGEYRAQALLGTMLFNGEHVQRQAARGLMWLTLARDSAGPDETWINDLYNAAFAKATEDERAMALHYLERWMRSRRD